MIRPLSAVLVSGSLVAAQAGAQTTTWLEARVMIEELAEAGEYEAAVKLEDVLLALVEQSFGSPSLQLAETNMLMASIHAYGGEYARAESRILASLDLYEAVAGSDSIRLIEPFLALGDNYHLAGDYEFALDAYDEAKALSRRAFGVLNDGQLAIFDKMSESALGLGDLREAMKLQEDALDLVQRAHGESSLDFLEANYRYASWLARHGAYRAADVHYHNMYDLIRDHFDDDDWLRLRLLRVDAENFRRAIGLAGPRQRPAELEEALEIARRLEDADPSLLAQIYLDLGDWNVAFDRDDDIEAALVRAWEELEGIEDGAELQDQWFAGLTVIRPAPLWSPEVSNRQGDPWGRVEVEFTVDTTGRARDAVVVASEPVGLMDSAAIRQVLSSRYRPRVEAGQVVESTRSVGIDYQYRIR